MKLLEILEDHLKSNPDYIDESGKLKKWVIVGKAQNYDHELIELILDKPELKESFFFEVRGALIFNKENFVGFLEQKSFLNDSYTRFKNKVGLTIGGKYLKQRDEVVLVWPFKDCVLEGGQSKEEQKRDEIFFNELLAQDEISQLLEPKVLTNVIRYDETGEHELLGFNRYAEINKERGLPENTITDNILIKGNNLLAMHSLKREFAGKVKLVYIDPPYNTENDSFRYNDRFTESTWLTFMKNRFEVARELLSDDGVIFVHCDDHEQAPLKLLMDEVFKGNFVETFVWKNTDNAPTLSQKTRKNVEFIHCYEKCLTFSRGYKGRESDNDDAPLLNTGNPVAELRFIPHCIKFRINDGFYKKGSYGRVELLDDLQVTNGSNDNTVRMKGTFKWQQSFLDEELKKGTYFLIKSNKFSIRYQRKESSTMAPDKLIDDAYLSKAIGVETNEDSKKHIDDLNLDFKSYPKPESLVCFLMKAVTEEGDIVLDYHLGSGTAATVAHKINRQYIAIEQMDYIESVVVERLKKVIEGEQGGISKVCNWKGGGEFVYLELKKYNQSFMDMIEHSQESAALLNIWEQMKAKSFLNYNVDIKTQDEHQEEFRTLSLKEQKQLLCEILDKNQLYVNLSSLNDQDFTCTDEEKRITKDFYQI